MPVKIPPSVAMIWGEEPGRQSQSRMAVLKDVDRRFRPDAVLWSDLIGFSVKGMPNGAIGDGIADDSESILAKNTAAVAANGGYIFFPPGTYRISTNLTIGSSTIQPRFAPGASLSIDSGVTVTMPIPDAGDYQIISGSGSVLFSGGPTGTYNPKWFGLDVSVTAAVNATAWSRFMSAIPVGAHVFVREGTYAAVGNLEVSKACTIEGAGPTTLFEFATNEANQGFNISASNVIMRGMKITGPQKASIETTQVGIRADGTSVSGYLTGIKLENLTINNWGGSGTQIRFCNNWYVQDCEVFDCYSNGIQVLQSNYGYIARNYVHTISSGSALGTEVYGIAITKNDGTEAVNPAPHDVSIVDNIVRDVRTWEGIDTHGGHRIKIIGNSVIDCIAGIVLAPFKATAGSEKSPSYCTIIGNNIYNNHGDGEVVDQSNQKYAVIINADSEAVSSVRGFGNVVSHNSIDGWGNESGSGIGDAQASLEFQYQQNLNVQGNTIVNNGRVAVGIFSCLNINMSGNTIDTVTGISADAADGTIVFNSNPLDGDTITLMGTVFTFKDSNGILTSEQILIGGAIEDTVDNLVTELNGHLDLNGIVDGKIGLCTYVKTETNTLTITFDTIGKFGESFTIARTGASITVSADNLTQTTGVGSCAIHNKNLSGISGSTGLIANNVFDIGVYTGVQSENDSLDLFISDNQHLGTGPLIDFDGSGSGPQVGVRRIDRLADKAVNVDLPVIADGNTLTINIGIPGMSANSTVVVSPNRHLEGMTVIAIPQVNYFELTFNNFTGGDVNIGPMTVRAYVNHDILTTS